MSAADAALLRGAQTCSVAACKLALSQGANPDAIDEDGDTALGCAAYEGSLELAILLLDAGASMEAVNRGGKTPLAQAAYSSSAKSADVVRELLRRGAAVEGAPGSERTPLHLAAQYGRLGALRALLEGKADAAALTAGKAAGKTAWQLAESKKETCEAVRDILASHGVKPPPGKPWFGVVAAAVAVIAAILLVSRLK